MNDFDTWAAELASEELQQKLKHRARHFLAANALVLASGQVALIATATTSAWPARERATS